MNVKTNLKHYHFQKLVSSVQKRGYIEPLNPL